jgi:hypothetical protein
MAVNGSGVPAVTAAAVNERVARATAGLAQGGRDWATAMDELAEELLAEDRDDGDEASLDAAILVRRLAIDQLVPELAGRVGVVLRNNLAVDLVDRYRSFGGLEDLLESCALSREVVAGVAPDELLIAAAGLAGRLSLLARNPGYQAELDHAIRLLTDVLRQAAPGDPARPTVMTSLAGLELHRWQRDGSLAALTDAAEAAGAALEAGEVTGATPNAGNVAVLLLECAEETHDLALLGKVEDLLRAVAEEGDEQDTVAAWGNLATTLITRFDLEGGEALLTEAIERATAAIDARSPGPSRAVDLSTRATARAALSRLRGDQGLLDDAIVDARAAVAQPAPYASDPSGPVNSLAMLLAERYDLLGDSANLDESIALHDALLASPGVAVDAGPGLLSNLANSLLSRFERDQRARDQKTRDRALADLRRAAELADEAISGTPPASVHLAIRHNTAAQVQSALAIRLGSASEAEQAERHARDAVNATLKGSPDRALYLNNWAMWVTDRWERTADPAALTEVIALLEEALAAAGDNEQLTATISFNLGARMQDRFERALERGDADRADLQRACDLLDDALAAGLPHITVPAGKRLGNIAISQRMWPQGEQALGLALAAAGDLTGLRPLRPDKQRARSGVQGIGALAALCAARAGNAATAALHLEQASATLLAEALGVRSDTVTSADITAACRAMGRSVLLLGSTYAGGLAVLADADGGCTAVDLPDLTEEAVRSATSTFRRTLAAALAEDPPAAGTSAAGTSAAGTSAAGPLAGVAAEPVAGVPAEPAAGDVGDSLDVCYAAGSQLLAWTWESVLAPLGALLAGTGRLAVLPLGRLAWLPITAAGPPGQPPALAPHEPVLLLRATAGPGTAGPPAGMAPRGQQPRVLVWADTGPGDRAIPGVLDEARQVAALYPGTRPRLHDRQASARVPLRGATPGTSPAEDSPGPAAAASAAADAVAALCEADIIHLACHCDVDPGQPEETVLRVDPPVRIGDMGVGVLDARSHVVLSACDAALTATSLPDEALSPAAALLLAGAGTVTAPVWPVDDEATAALMTDYHRRLAAGEGPGHALSQVQADWSVTRPPFVYAPWVVVIRPPSGAGAGA